MSDRIKLLPDLVANQIAAGEVVERPASVVKELMENAIDAGATMVTVNFADGGREFIQIVDNGCGMSTNDARLAFDRHATSKISSADDLYALRTFGFRGEALPSIASVAQVELRTRQRGEELGTRVVIDGGRFVSQEVTSAPEGTMFVVRDLFYNLPGRRRHLKEGRVEARHILSEFTRVALVNTDVAFALYNNDVPVFNLPVTNLRQRIAGVIGKNISANLLDLNVETSLCNIRGFVGRPSSAKKKNGEQYLFVNGRYFAGGYFRSAILQAYNNLIPSDMQPAYFLYFDIDPAKIDVNIHPKKTEIKFEDEQAIWQILNAAVRESLAKTGVVPIMDFDIDNSIDIPVFKDNGGYRPPETGINPNFNPFNDEQQIAYNFGHRGGHSVGGFAEVAADREFYSSSHVDNLSPVAEELLRDEIMSGIDFEYTDQESLDFINGGGEQERISSSIEFDEDYKVEQSSIDFGGVPPLSDIIQVSAEYAVAKCGEDLILFDINRAYYKVRYHFYERSMGHNNIISEQLLFPEVVTLSKSECSLLKENAAELESIGFDLTFDDDEHISVTGLPPAIKGTSQTILAELADSICEEIPIYEEHRCRMCRVLAYMDARSASHSYEAEELRPLLEELFRCNDYSFTPDGKAIMSIMSKSEIAKRLK